MHSVGLQLKNLSACLTRLLPLFSSIHMHWAVACKAEQLHRVIPDAQNPSRCHFRSVLTCAHLLCQHLPSARGFCEGPAVKCLLVCHVHEGIFMQRFLPPDNKYSPFVGGCNSRNHLPVTESLAHIKRPW